MVFEAAIKNKCFFILSFFCQAEYSEGLDDFSSVSCMHERKRDGGKHKETEGSHSQKARKCGFFFFFFCLHLKTFILFLSTLLFILSIPLTFFLSRGDFVLKTNVNAETMRESDVLYF